MKAEIGTTQSSFVKTEATNTHLVIDWMLFTKEVATIELKTIRRDTEKSDSIHFIKVCNLSVWAAQSLQVYLNERL